MPEHYYCDVKIGEMLTLLARDYGDREALVYPTRALRYSFRALEAEACKIARGLLSLGIEKGARVALWATNLPEWVVLEFALAKIGAILVTVNTSFRGGEVEYLLAQSEACAIIMMRACKDHDYCETMRALIPQLENSQGEVNSEKFPWLRHAILIDDEDVRGFINYRELRVRAGQVSDAQLQERSAQLAL